MSETPRTDAFIAGLEPVRLPRAVGNSLGDSIAIGSSIRALMLAHADFARSLEKRVAALEAGLNEFAYKIADIGTLSDDVLREAAGDVTESATVKQLAPAILRARALLEKRT